jgi:putative NIF3 family GTP cyclohydrolase 1 type 2
MTGWNEAFADKHLIARDDRRCIQGYKNDPDRRIGLVGRLNTPLQASICARMLSHAFGGHDAMELPNTASEDDLCQIEALASLNAFTPEVIERVVQASQELGIKPQNTICLTGAVREPGMEEARKLGLNVVAVGHVRCEMWGLRYLERMARQRFPGFEIELIDEPEEVIERKPKQPKAKVDNPSDEPPDNPVIRSKDPIPQLGVSGVENA